MKYEKYIRPECDITKTGYKLICLPYAGGGATSYYGWQKYFNEIEIVPIQLPGHENRIGESLINDCNNITIEIANAIKPYISSCRFSVFGHSMGGIIGYSLTRYLEDKGYYPDVCFVSATDIGELDNMISSAELDDVSFFERVSLFGGIDKDSEVLKFPEFKTIFMDILRADFGIVESYKYDGNKSRCPIVGFCGDKDPMENLERMNSIWKTATNSSYTSYGFYGDHFYLKDNLKEVSRIIKKSISKSIIN